MVLSDPVPQTPGAPQKTITELLTQWADLTDAAIAATGVTEGWFRGAILDGVNFSGAEMSTAVGLTQRQLDRTCGDRSTELPRGLRIPECEQR